MLKKHVQVLVPLKDVLDNRVTKNYLKQGQNFWTKFICDHPGRKQ